MTFSENAVYISLKQASDKYGVSKKVLLGQINSGTLPAVELKTGEVLVADRKIDSSLFIKREDFAHLRGKKLAYKHYKGQMRRVSVFDEQGNPYQIRHNETVAIMRSKRRQKSKNFFSKILQVFREVNPCANMTRNLSQSRNADGLSPVTLGWKTVFSRLTGALAW